MITMCNCKSSAEMNGNGRCPNGGDVTFVGAVLDTFEKNGYDDSDFCAVVWDAERGSVRTVEYASTRGWTYHNGASIDATDEAQAAALAWYRAKWETYTIEDETAAASLPILGSVVRSTTKRGKNVGIVGTVEWVGDNAYANRWDIGQALVRFGVHVEGEPKRRYLTGSAVEIVTPRTVDVAAIVERAKTVKPHNWRSGVMVGFSARAHAYA